jgi:hypothetical protein
MGDNPLSAPGGAVERLREFRSGFYRSWSGWWADAGFEACDSLLCSAGPVSSVPGLSVEPVFRRGHGSLYKALAAGGVDEEAARDLLVAHRPAGWPLVFAVDASTWARCDAETSPGRGYWHCASKASHAKPVVAGWSYQWVAQLGWEGDSWTAPMDAVRLRPGQDQAGATCAQVAALTRRLAGAAPGRVPVFVVDAGYNPAALAHGLSGVPATIVARIRDDRVFHTTPEPAPGPRPAGRPRRHGQRRDCKDPETWPAPDWQSTSRDPRYGVVRVAAWHNLHPKLSRKDRWAGDQPAPIIPATIIRVDVEHPPKPASRANKTLWLWVSTGAAAAADLDVCWRAYLRRFDIEHTFRFAKNTLGWTTPAVRTPEQADLWTWLVIAALTQLRLARPIVADQRLPWERSLPPGELTPNRVRRAFPSTRHIIGTPARPPKPSRAGPGRPKGTPKPPRTRYPVIKSGA